MKLTTLVALVVIAAVACATWAVVKRKSDVRIEEIEVLSLETVVTFFRRPEVADCLKSSSDLTAVALRSETGENGIDVALAIFDRNTKRVEKSLLIYRVKKLDLDLINMFGDKDMLVLR